MEQGKPLIITGAAFSGSGLLLIIASFVFSSNPMLSAGCATIIVGLVLVGIAAAKQSVEAGTRLDNLTFVVATSVVPSNPSIVMIQRVIESAIAMHGMPEKIVVAMDGLQEGRTDADYDEYERRIRSEIPYVTVTRRPTRGYLTGNLEHAMRSVKTQFVMVIQHDFRHVMPIDLRPLMQLIEDDRNDVQYIRLNKRHNWERMLWDADPVISMKEKTFENGVTLTTTPAWSDNDHLCLTAYYTDTVLPLAKERNARFPEEALNPINRAQNRCFGTYLYGGERTTNAIEHLDGKVFKE